jgi:hypothetical protein
MGTEAILNSILASQLLSAAGQVGVGVSARSGARRDARTLRDIGEISAQDAVRQGGRVIGAQRAGFGAAGVDVNVGTPTEVTRDTAEQVELEALRERFRFGSAAQQLEREGDVAFTRSILGATSTFSDALALRTLGDLGKRKSGKRRRPRVAIV